MLRRINGEIAQRRSASTSRRSSVMSTPYESFVADETFSSFSDDSDSERKRRGRRKAVANRKGPKPSTKAAPARARATSKERVDQPKVVPAAAKKLPKVSRKKVAVASPVSSTDEIVKIAKKEGTTKFHQMRKFLEKVNEADQPVDVLGGLLKSHHKRTPDRAHSRSPRNSGRLSIDSLPSPKANDFHTGLTPSSAERKVFSPTVQRRDSDEAFAASDLLAGFGEAANNKIGAFIHGQRSLNLRRKMNTVAAGDNIHLSLVADELHDGEKQLEKFSRFQKVKRILVNTAEDDEYHDKENEDGTSVLEDSFVAAAEAEMMLGQ